MLFIHIFYSAVIAWNWQISCLEMLAVMIGCSLRLFTEALTVHLITVIKYYPHSIWSISTYVVNFLSRSRDCSLSYSCHGSWFNQWGFNGKNFRVNLSEKTSAYSFPTLASNILNFSTDLHCGPIFGPKMEGLSLKFSKYNTKISCARCRLAERYLAPRIMFSQCKSNSISIETCSKSLPIGVSWQDHFVFNETISQVVLCNEFRPLPARHAKMQIANW